MKKVLLFFVALLATLSMNAQTTEIYKGTAKEATYSGADVTVKFGTDSIRVSQGGVPKASYPADYKVVSKELPPSTGEALRKPNVPVKWVQLWQDGPKFAEYNIGANTATDYGYYLAWGGNDDKNTAYNAGSTNLSGSDDSAYAFWGPNWRMPTKEDFNSLLSKCTCTWTQNYNGTGVNGLLCTGKGDYSSNSIFLPAPGYYDGSVNEQGNYGFYWSSTPNSNLANLLSFSSGHNSVSSSGTRSIGYSVRPIYVADEDLVAVTGVSLNKTELKVGTGNTETLSATVAPENATNKKVSWETSDETVATVDKYGKVTGVGTGECVIKATTEDGEKTATCNVVVEIKTTGTAKAKINRTYVEVRWIQLWSEGPKFAEYNVAGKMARTNAAKTGAEYVWGANWKTPSKDELNELFLAAAVDLDSTSTKVKCEYTQEGSTWGFKFTGKEPGYTSSSVFFPASDYGSGQVLGYQEYWSSTPADMSKGRYMLLYRTNTEKLKSEWVTDDKASTYLVRPVLNESK